MAAVSLIEHRAASQADSPKCPTCGRPLYPGEPVDLHKTQTDLPKTGILSSDYGRIHVTFASGRAPADFPRVGGASDVVKFDGSCIIMRGGKQTLELHGRDAKRLDWDTADILSVHFEGKVIWTPQETLEELLANYTWKGS